MDKALIIASVASMVDQFLFPSATLLQNIGYEVHVACNFENGNTCSVERIEELKKSLKDHNILFTQIDFVRDVSKIHLHKKAYKQLCSIIGDNDFKIIHCHSPIGGVLGRLAARKARKQGTRVFYTAHGFHFYKGASKLNWMVYYPIEKFCSRYTDKLITINKEDYNLAKEKFRAGEVCYIPGVGVDLSRFENVQVDRNAKRREIGVPEDAFLLLSVGELNENKNHQIIIKALARLKNSSIHYAIAGVGDKKEYLLNLATELGIGDQVHLLGYRKDIPELNYSADAFCFPSYREGLPVSVIEALVCGLSLICSNIRGNLDLVELCGGYLFDPRSVDECCDSLIKAINSKNSLIGEVFKKNLAIFSTENIIEKMKKLYER